MYGIYPSHHKKYFASIHVDGKTHYIGKYKNHSEASYAVLRFIKNKGCTCKKVVYKGV